MRILVIQQKMIGDVLISTLLCKNLKLWNSDVQIDFVANRHTLDVIQNNPYIDKVIIFEDTFKKDKRALFRFLLNLRKKRYDFIIDAYGKLESLLICLFTPATKKIGYKKFYTTPIYNQSYLIKKIRKGTLQLSLENRFQLLEPITGGVYKNTDVEIHLTPEEIRESREKFDRILGEGNQAIMVSAIGSSQYKTYPLEYMAKLLDVAYITTKLPFVLNYRPDQEKQIDELIGLLKPNTQGAVMKSLTPHSLRDYMATVYHCVAAVGNEGGAINIAKGLNKPTFAIFSPSIDPVGWHTEIPNRCMAVDLKTFFPDAVDYAAYKKLVKKPEKIIELYKMLKPELFKSKWTRFFKECINLKQ
ncbi:MAG: glycosyltransferase family 9 protein [Flavobacteriaceae bacterium]|jgi:ADP-heptose:LPS heptosyltransferase